MDKRASLDDAPIGPPEMQVRPGLKSMVEDREQAQGASMPGMGGPNAVGTRAMAAEQALGALAQVMPDPAPLTDIIARLRAAVAIALQSSASPQTSGPGLAGIVAPPTPIAPPAMGGAGMPAPPMM